MYSFSPLLNILISKIETVSVSKSFFVNYVDSDTVIKEEH